MDHDRENGSGQQSPPKEAAQPFRFSISGTFTAEPIRPAIAFWGPQLGSEFEIRFAPYNQIHQVLLDPSGEFARNQHGANVMLVRLEDLGQFEGADEALGRIEANTTHLMDEIRQASTELTSPLIFCLCAPSPTVLADAGRLAFHRRVAGRIASALEDVPGIQFLSWEQIDEHYPVARRDNPEGDRIGHIPYSDLYFAALGTAIVRLAHALVMPAYKVIALDCDNTLWQGICGEDGPTGVIVDEPRRALQRFMAGQRDAGMLLVISSKNNESDVRETFAQHPGMPLRLSDFAGWRIDWESKAPNLEALARELSVGLDSFILVDDNHKECAEVEESAPEVLALTLPEDVRQIPRFLEHVWAFDHPVITEEDRHRNVYYIQSREFGREARAAASLEQFLSTLELTVDVRPLQPERLTRVAQLTQRTNQFNFTSIRRSESDIQALERGGFECLTVNVTDRFGDYGLVGVVIFSVSGGALDVDTFLLSCRALGRGVEHRVLAHLGELARERGLRAVTLRLAPTAKNAPARQFVEAVARNRLEQTPAGMFARIPAGELTGVERLATVTSTSESPAKGRAPKKKAQRRSVDYARIATDLSTPEHILEAVRAWSRGSRAAVGEAMSEIEQRLADIWSELLERPVLHREDNFFDLGGHSLLAVLLLLRIRESFGVELSIDDLYSGALTLCDLAVRIETEQLGKLNPEQYAALLAEIESMSDEEVREMLAREESAPTAEMRILLTSNASHDPPRGGATRTNLVWLRYLAAAGHTCRVVCASLAEDSERAAAALQIRSIKEFSRRAAVLEDDIREFRPDWVLVSSEDLGHGILRHAAHAAPDRLVYMAHTPQFFPFGPESWNRDPAATAIVQRAQAVISIGEHMRDYIRKHAGINAEVIRPAIYGGPPYPRLGSFESGYVLMINPCGVKGISIFVELALRFPSIPFAGLRGWGTTSRDLEMLATLPNATVLEQVPHIEEVLAGARLLLMPSLWYEGFGLIVMEAMLRGLPVVASNYGGLAEAKRGTGYLIPVCPIEHYKARTDEVHMPEPEIPEQDLAPWAAALSTLLADRAAWEQESERSREAALRFVADVRPDELEKFLAGLAMREPSGATASAATEMSDAKRLLLLEKLRRSRNA